MVNTISSSHRYEIRIQGHRLQAASMEMALFPSGASPQVSTCTRDMMLDNLMRKLLAVVTTDLKRRHIKIMRRRRVEMPTGIR
jgi:hypothetical protein